MLGSDKVDVVTLSLVLQLLMTQSLEYSTLYQGTTCSGVTKLLMTRSL